MGGAQRDAKGAFKISYLTLDTLDCPSSDGKTSVIIADAQKGAKIPATIEADTLTCSASVSDNEYCAAGKLTLRFDGPVVEGDD